MVWAAGWCTLLLRLKSRGVDQAAESNAGPNIAQTKALKSNAQCQQPPPRTPPPPQHFHMFSNTCKRVEALADQKILVDVKGVHLYHFKLQASGVLQK